MIREQQLRYSQMSGVTRFLIRLSGGSPDAVAREPRDRTHYIGLAWTMLGTASLAVTGMFILLTQITEWSIPFRLFVGAAWGMFVLGIDYLVVGYVDYPNIAARQMTSRGQRVRRVNPGGAFFRMFVRVLFAVVIGLVVGESMVIGVFNSAANKYLDDEELKDAIKESCKAASTLSLYRPEVTPGADCEAPAKEEAQTTTTIAPPKLATSAGTDEQIKTYADQIKVLNEEIARQSERAQCEQYPSAFNPDQRAALNCSGIAGNGVAWKAAMDQQAAARAEKDAITAQLNAIGARNADAVKKINDATAEAEAERIKHINDNRDSAPAKAAEAKMSTADAQIADIKARECSPEARATKEPGCERIVAPKAWGLSERFDATEKANVVNPWIRWGLRLFFILADMAPVLMKLAMGPSLTDIEIAMSRHEAGHQPRMGAIQREEEFERATSYLRTGSSGNGMGGADPPPPRRGWFGRGSGDDDSDRDGAYRDGPTGWFRRRETANEDAAEDPRAGTRRNGWFGTRSDDADGDDSDRARSRGNDWFGAGNDGFGDDRERDRGASNDWNGAGDGGSDDDRTRRRSSGSGWFGGGADDDAEEADYAERDPLV